MGRTAGRQPGPETAAERPARPSGAPAGTDSIALVVPETESRLFSEPYFYEIIHGAAAKTRNSMPNA